MKTILCLLVPALLVLTSCSTMSTSHSTQKAKADDSTPETVIVRYQVKPGSEAQLQALLASAWQVYCHGHMVLSHPHIIAAERGADYKVQITEIFTWVNRRAPQNAPQDVQKIWAAMQTLCEPRNGQSGVGGGEVQLITD